ncbi:flagellin [Ectothiorhodospira variabilis]|uniref:flagellin N-terminal helical domain-containing protein n=1 Tax=Ectothiorhodospira variabilis TaxID=505694 RepID=UPI001EFA8685|nr:flagellin [Ectothiorhodospira variabilis]MCG5494659.1 flagellin FliC [Ectothiorhodospira variabilis]MCG5499063.1 flagellin FliC [Ectothiorhodospira variabilis]MCG5505119.1 flagellin FliC [Ectothiorhodospira variabilis]MCG5508276.1 flagellin FliC [Ectothiorhodospira variabilis]
MSQVINTNIASLNAQRNLNATQGQLQTSLERLSSGLRINSAKDDAAGLAISERFSAQIRGLNQAARNANDGISLAQTAEGALSEISNNLQRMRELVVQAANDSNSGSDREVIQKEIAALTSEIGRVIDQTKFNEIEVLKASTELTFQVGANNGDTITVNLEDILNLSTASFGTVDLTDIDVGGASAGAIGDFLDELDTAITVVADARAELGAIQNRFESVVANLNNASENLSASRSRILDADFAQETANLTRSQILQQAGTSVLAQANQAPNNVLALLQ